MDVYASISVVSVPRQDAIHGRAGTGGFIDPQGVEFVQSVQLAACGKRDKESCTGFADMLLLDVVFRTGVRIGFEDGAQERQDEMRGAGA